MSRKPAAIALAVGVALVVIGLVIIELRRPENRSFQVSTGWLQGQPSGPVRFCGGEDISGSGHRAMADYTERYGPGSTAIYSASSFVTDEQRNQWVKSIENGSNDCDVITLDVIYMPEFVAKHLLYDMTPYLKQHDRRADFDPRMLPTVEREGRLWGVPSAIDVGVLYYRTDKVPRPPRSWQEVFEEAKPRPPDNLPGLRIQVGPYEGLTVILLELAYSAGAERIIKDGRTANLDQPQVLEALRFLRNAIRDRVIPAREQADTSNLERYTLGRARFLRGWPFVAGEIRKAREGAGTGSTLGTRRARRTAAVNTAIIPLPPWRPGGTSVGILGGHDLVIPRSAPHPSAALRLIDFLTSADEVRLGVESDSQIPVRKDLAEEFSIGNRELLDAIKKTQVVARPSIPQYAEVSAIISCRVTGIIHDRTHLGLSEQLRYIERDVQHVLDGGSSDIKSGTC